MLGALTMLAGCTSVATEPAMVAPAAGAEAEPSPDTREFSKQELYDLLVAEMAAKRDQLPVAIEKYLRVARQSHDPGVAERAVRLAMYAKDPEGSLEAARLWTEVAPDATNPRQVYGTLLMRTGRIDEAVEQYQVIISSASEGIDHGFDLVGQLLGRERNRQVALDVMRRLVSGHEENTHGLFAYARLAARAGQVEQAAGLLEKLLSIDPRHESGAVLYARVLQQEGNVPEALDALARSLEKNPDSQAVRMTYARLLVDARRYDEALQQFQKLVVANPGNVDVQYAMGLLLLQTNRPTAAREHFVRLAESADHRDVARFYLGQIAESLDQHDEALAAYKSVGRGEHYLNAQVRVAVILAKQGDVDAAREHLHGLQRNNPQQDIRIVRAEAEILSSSDRLEEAMAVYDEAIDAHAGNTDLLYARAMLAEKLDLLDVLERDLRAILDKEPDNADALNALGFTLADRTDRFDEALTFIQRAIELKPDDFYIIDSMGWVLYRFGRYAEAVEYLRRALSMSDDPEVAAHLGEVMWVMGDKEGGREVWNTALKTSPDDERLLEVIKKFSD